MKRALLFLPLFLVFIVAPACAQRSDSVMRIVKGRLTEQGSGKNLALAHVEALDASGQVIARTRTGSNGLFELPIPSTMKNAEVTLRFHRKGWFPQRIENYFPSRETLTLALKRHPFSKKAAVPRWRPIITPCF